MTSVISNSLIITPMKRTNEVICLDIETTRRPRHTIEIGMVKLALVKGDIGKHLTIVDSLDTLVKPSVRVDNYDDHSITDENLKKAPELWQIAPKLFSFIGDKATFVAHNCSSEYTLFKELEDLGYSMKFWMIDTKEMSKALAQECFGNKTFFRNSRLLNLVQRFRCPSFQPHRALDDAVSCANLYVIMRQFLRGHGYKRWRGFKQLAEEHNFMYLKEFTSRKKEGKPVSRAIRLNTRSLLSRVPDGEKLVLRKLYWYKHQEIYF